jgi:hypothetical protein
VDMDMGMDAGVGVGVLDLLVVEDTADWEN